MSRYPVTAALGVCLQLGSCAHASSSPPTAAAVAQPAPSAPAAKKPELLPRAPEDGIPIARYMEQHFTIATWVRDAVVDGALGRIVEPLRTLADYEYEAVVPGGWMQGVSKLQATARLMADAETLEAAASGMAAMARVCGQCHLEQHHPVPLEHYREMTETPRADELPNRMFRHAWAAERLWEGLMAPSDQAWRAGALALAHAPQRPPKPREPAPRDFAASFDALRDLGLRASSAETLDERVDIYGLTLATCSRCHADVDEHDQIRALGKQGTNVR